MLVAHVTVFGGWVMVAVVELRIVFSPDTTLFAGTAVEETVPVVGRRGGERELLVL